MTLSPRTQGDLSRISADAKRRREILDKLDRAEATLGELHDREVQAARDLHAVALAHRQAREVYDRQALAIRELRRELVAATREPLLTADVEQQRTEEPTT